MRGNKALFPAAGICTVLSYIVFGGRPGLEDHGMGKMRERKRLMRRANHITYLHSRYVLYLVVSMYAVTVSYFFAFEEKKPRSNPKRDETQVILVDNVTDHS